ncbi:hypothetical protein M231_06261 [Tremella mesenterica]|uniref:Uncharacterized protein n=1 Tax=Tremella mesenterica TaxID=5217 RepID=A0A4Q1BDU8_TREME|nr:hypothetical protein M231_06261 [Tremella mesenterica]
MWNIKLGYSQGADPDEYDMLHWELVLEYDNSTSDNSLVCPHNEDDFDSDDSNDDYKRCGCPQIDWNLFLENDQGEVVPQKWFQFIHSTYDDQANEWEFSHHSSNSFSTKMTLSSVLGTITDAQLDQAINACGEVDLPDDDKDENCQDFIRRALDVLNGKFGLVSSYQQTVDKIRYQNNEG